MPLVARSTRLVNALIKPLNRTGPAKVIVAILTDGLENASQEFKRKEIFKMIKHQREVSSWEFVFLGAKQDAISTGAKMGIPIANAVTFSEASGVAAPAFDAVSRVAASYRAGDADYVQYLAKAAKKEKPKL